MSKDANNDAAVIRSAARSVASDAAYDRLVEMAGDAQCVLIGEASHGTHEFYETRAQLTKRLINQKGFRAVALEADWPDTFRVHRFVTGRGDDRNVEEGFAGVYGLDLYNMHTSIEAILGYLDKVDPLSAAPGAVTAANNSAPTSPEKPPKETQNYGEGARGRSGIVSSFCT